MSTRIVDLDLERPLPGDLPLDGAARLWAVGWRAGVPVGAALLEPSAGERVVRAEAVAAAVAGMPDRAELPPPVTGGTPPTVSVIVCTRDRPEELPIVLESLRGQTVADFEVVVVDNAPRDERTRQAVAELWPSARYVVEPVPGLPRARNAGMRAASGEVLAFTDDDCRVGPVWIETFARAFAAEPGLGCVTGPILPVELATAAQEAMEARGGFNRGWQRRRYTLAGETRPVAGTRAGAGAGTRGGTHARPGAGAGAAVPPSEGGSVYPVQAWRFGAGGTFALARGCAAELGGFDEALWKSEDLDIFYRVLRAGAPLAFEPGAAVRHRHLREWSQLSRRLFDWGWAYQAFLDKIVRGDTPEYAARARLERDNWLLWQLRARLGSALRGRADLPLPLVAREIAGGLVGRYAYPLARAAAARRAARLGATAVTPGPVVEVARAA